MKQHLVILETLKLLAGLPDPKRKRTRFTVSSHFQVATVNTNTLNAVMDLTKLKSLDWGIMIDDGTSIILDGDGGDSEPAEKSSKCDAEKKTECIPFLPQKEQNGEAESTSGDVELMPEYTSIAQLVERLCGYLPDTKIRVFRIPVLNAVSVVNAYAS